MAASELSKKYDKFGSIAAEAEAADAAPSSRFPGSDLPYAPDAKVHFSASEVASAQHIPQTAGVVWQVAASKLRVWSAASTADEDDPNPQPVRPYITVLLALAPKTDVLSYRMFTPGEELPEPAALLQWLLACMQQPANLAAAKAADGGAAPPRAAARPEKVVFTSLKSARACHASLEALGVSCAMWKPLPQLDTFVTKYSTMLVEADAAAVTAASGRPGMQSSGVDGALFGLFWRTAQWFFSHTPWRGSPERMTYRVTWDEELSTMGVRVPPCTVWVSIMGRTAEDSQAEEQGTSDSAQMARRLEAGDGAKRLDPSLQDVSGNVGDVRGRRFESRFGARGVSMFWSRWDAEQRLVGHMDAELGEALAALRELEAEERVWASETPAEGAPAATVGDSMVRFQRLSQMGQLRASLRGMDTSSLEVRAVGTPFPGDLVCARPGCGKEGGKMQRCTRCRGVYYCGKDCQVAHWPEHKRGCVKATPMRKAGTVAWGAREAALLFSDVLALPFDDLDAVDALGLHTVDPAAHPMATVIRKGRPDRPSPAEALLLCRAMVAVAQVASSLPERANCFLPSAGEVEVPMSAHAVHSSSAPEPAASGAGSGAGAPAAAPAGTPAGSTPGGLDDPILTGPELQFYLRAAGAALHVVNDAGCVVLPEGVTPNIAVPAKIAVAGDIGTARVALDPMSTPGERADMLARAKELKAHLASKGVLPGAPAPAPAPPVAASGGEAAAAAPPAVPEA